MTMHGDGCGTPWWPARPPVGDGCCGWAFTGDPLMCLVPFQEHVLCSLARRAIVLACMDVRAPDSS